MEVRKFVLGPVMTNMYVVSEGGKGFLVDCAYPSEEVCKYIDENNIDIKFIIQTHTHFDHVTGLSFFKNRYKVKVYASKNAKDIANDKDYNLGFHINNLEVPIDVYLEDGEIFSDFDIKAISTPGHSLDSMSYALGDMIFTGDTLFRLSIGRTDFEGGSYSQIIKSIKEKLGKFDMSSKVYPGHNQNTSLGFEFENNPFLQ